MTRISAEEYARLSDQKAEDWRHISEVNPTLFGVAGAIFAAGVADEQAWILAMSPLPLFLGVFHMIRSAKLQIQMITYMAAARESAGTWEADISRLLRPVWRARESQGVRSLLGFVGRLSAWNTWLAIAFTTDVLVNVTSWVGGYEDAPLASAVGVALAITFGTLLALQANAIEKERDMWTVAWKVAEDPQASDEDIERAAREARFGQ